MKVYYRAWFGTFEVSKAKDSMGPQEQVQITFIQICIKIGNQSVTKEAS